MQGTPVTQAPEVITQQYGCECDIWSLGATLYFIASGELPFDISDEETLLDLAKKIITDEPKYPKFFSEDFVNLLKQMLDKDSDTRISLQKILEHPFITKNQDKLETTQSTDDSKFSNEILLRMKEFHGSSLLKKAAMRVFVEHIDPKQINDLKQEFQRLDDDKSGFLEF